MSSRFRRPGYKSGNTGPRSRDSSNNNRRGYDLDAATPTVERPRKRQTISVFWLVPLFAALLGLYLAYNFYKEQGPLITIQFNTAEGLIAGKTPIRYRDVNIGLVEKIHLSDDLERVIVEARMTVDSKNYLNNHARFWVVRPRVGTSGVSGLNTLLSGAYIQVNSLVGTAFQTSFKGLEKPPLTEEGAPGLRLNLQAEQAGYVGIGSPVYYRQVKVGQIEAQRFLPDYKMVEFTIFIEAPHHKIVRNTTKFWNVSGVSLNVNANGLSVRTPSLEGLAQGGVAFDIIEEYEFPYKVEDGHVFTLHDSQESATEDTLDLSSARKFQYVTYFDGSVRGLSTGAPVEYKGVQIGRVTDIGLMYDESAGVVRVPVHIEFQSDRLLGIESDDTETLNSTIVRRLRAKLQTGNLLTGQLFVSLVAGEDGSAMPLQTDADGIFVLPSVKSDLEQVTEGVQSALQKINSLPLEDLIANASDTVLQAQQLLSDFNQLGVAARIEGTVNSADGALQEYARLATGMRKEISSLTEQMGQFIATADESFEGIAPDSPLYYNLLNTLKDLQQAARAVLAVSESVEKKPEEFLFGK